MDKEIAKKVYEELYRQLMDFANEYKKQFPDTCYKDFLDIMRKVESECERS